MSPTGYLSAVRSGVSGHTLKAVIKVIGEQELIARAIGKDASNLSKSYQLKRLSSIAADNLIDTLRVYIQAAALLLMVPSVGVGLRDEFKIAIANPLHPEIHKINLIKSMKPVYSSKMFAGLV